MSRIGFLQLSVPILDQYIGIYIYIYIYIYMHAYGHPLCDIRTKILILPLTLKWTS